MKKIKEWGTMLPEDIKRLFFANILKKKVNYLCVTLDEAITEAFDWENSPEGFHFWEKVNKNAVDWEYWSNLGLDNN